jgi:hypothetical protein
VELDPLVGLDDPRAPLRSRVLAVPALRRRYLNCVHAIARDWLDWERLGPVAEGFASLIDREVERDTRKLISYEAFRHALRPQDDAPGPAPRRMSLPAFCRARREYLLQLPVVREAVAATDQAETGPRHE